MSTDAIHRACCTFVCVQCMHVSLDEESTSSKNLKMEEREKRETREESKRKRERERQGHGMPRDKSGIYIYIFRQLTASGASGSINSFEIALRNSATWRRPASNGSGLYPSMRSPESRQPVCMHARQQKRR